MRLLVLAAALLVFSGHGIPASLSAEDVVKRTTEQVLARMQLEHGDLSGDLPQLYAIVEELVLPRFDFPRMSRWALGKHWRTLDDAKRQQFSVEFRIVLVRAYASVLLEYSDERFSYSPAEPMAQGQFVVVKQQITKPGLPAACRSNTGCTSTHQNGRSSTW